MYGGGPAEPCDVAAIVDTISECGWQPEHTASVLNTLAELSMCAARHMHAFRLQHPASARQVASMPHRSDAARKLVMQKALQTAARAQLTDIPTISHQLMLFCSAGLIGQALLVRMRGH